MQCTSPTAIPHNNLHPTSPTYSTSPSRHFHIYVRKDYDGYNSQHQIQSHEISCIAPTYISPAAHLRGLQQLFSSSSIHLGTSKAQIEILQEGCTILIPKNSMQLYAIRVSTTGDTVSYSAVLDSCNELQRPQTWTKPRARTGRIAVSSSRKSTIVTSRCEKIITSVTRFCSLGQESGVVTL